MQNRARFGRVCLLSLVCFLLGACSQQGGATQPSATPLPTLTPTPVPLDHYLATADNNSWSFTFDVNEASPDTISSLAISIPTEFTCGGTVIDTAAVATLDPIPIYNGQFTATHQFNEHGTVTITGTINVGAKTASGTWQMVGGPFQLNCSGAWTAHA